MKDNTVLQDKDATLSDLVTNEDRSSVSSMMVSYLYNNFIDFNDASRVYFSFFCKLFNLVV